jgi:hypothetical protein
MIRFRKGCAVAAFFAAFDCACADGFAVAFFAAFAFSRAANSLFSVAAMVSTLTLYSLAASARTRSSSCPEYTRSRIVISTMSRPKVHSGTPYQMTQYGLGQWLVLF